MFSNKYIFIYSSVMVILVAILLSLAATLLKPAQDDNIKIEKMQQILKSANIVASVKEAIPLYEKYITNELILDKDGNVLSDYSKGKFIKGDQRAFEINLKEELKKLDPKSESKEAIHLPLFIFVNEKSDTLYIIPLYGKGLWGPIWGNIAFKNDKNTVEGVTFGHKGETPGLGAEIDGPKFQEQFFGKQIFDETGKFVSIRVVKGGVKNSTMNPIYGVDAVSGGTITSNGVNEMLNTCLKNYEPYFKK